MKSLEILSTSSRQILFQNSLKSRQPWDDDLYEEKKNLIIYSRKYNQICSLDTKLLSNFIDVKSSRYILFISGNKQTHSKWILSSKFFFSIYFKRLLSLLLVNYSLKKTNLIVELRVDLNVISLYHSM